MIYAGSGLMGREIANIRSCDSIGIAGDRTGTLGEPATAYDEGRLPGILTGTGGITGLVEEMRSPSARLIDRLLTRYEFLGVTGTSTGSKHLQLAVEPASMDWVVLTHANAKERFVL